MPLDQILPVNSGFVFCTIITNLSLRRDSALHDFDNFDDLFDFLTLEPSVSNFGEVRARYGVIEGTMALPSQIRRLLCSISESEDAFIRCYQDPDSLEL